MLVAPADYVVALESFLRHRSKQPSNGAAAPEGLRESTYTAGAICASAASATDQCGRVVV